MKYFDHITKIIFNL